MLKNLTPIRNEGLILVYQTTWLSVIPLFPILKLHLVKSRQHQVIYLSIMKEDKGNKAQNQVKCILFF